MCSPSLVQQSSLISSYTTLSTMHALLCTPAATQSVFLHPVLFFPYILYFRVVYGVLSSLLFSTILCRKVSLFNTLLCTKYRAVYTPEQFWLNLLDIIRRHTLRNSPPLNIRPSIPSIAIHQHEPIPLFHIPLHCTARTILVQGLDVLQFFGPAAGGNCRSDLLA